MIVDMQLSLELRVAAGQYTWVDEKLPSVSLKTL